MLQRRYTADAGTVEVGVDEAGRGPMWGPVFAAAVVLPADSPTFPYGDMKDSKRFHSKKRINEVAEVIRREALAWAVASRSSEAIDRGNIRSATHAAMHDAIKSALSSLTLISDPILLIDGTDFTPLPWSRDGGEVGFAHHTCVPKGDNRVASIAAASILAKVARDTYVAEACVASPILSERYGLDKNQGYGTPQHLAGLRAHGLSAEHRRTFGLCARIHNEELS
tara:strand:- start:2871 stop:3545 length:675 start_codon:yes stop_codon:yes gene_type:complete